MYRTCFMQPEPPQGRVYQPADQTPAPHMKVQADNISVVSRLKHKSPKGTPVPLLQTLCRVQAERVVRA